MTARCHACRTRNHPLRWRTLFDCWYCPRCETVRIRVVVNQLITELTGYFLGGVAARLDAAIQATADGVAAVITG
jgi:hypothetical protein